MNTTEDPECSCEWVDVLGPGYPLLKVNENPACAVCVLPDLLATPEPDPTGCPCGAWQLGCPTEESCHAE